MNLRVFGKLAVAMSAALISFAACAESISLNCSDGVCTAVVGGVDYPLEAMDWTGVDVAVNPTGPTTAKFSCPDFEPVSVNGKEGDVGSSTITATVRRIKGGWGLPRLPAGENAFSATVTLQCGPIPG